MAMPYENFLIAAVPIFLIAMFFEIIITELFMKKKSYAFQDTITSLSASIISRFCGMLFGKTLFTLPYAFLFENFHIWHFAANSWLEWLAALLVIDLGYYIHHRIAHEINIFWSGHVVHHSSEYFNFSTALRQGFFENLFSFVWYLPMALCFDVETYKIVNAFNSMFQFWVHTETIGKFPYIIEIIFNTPSHHRVHHARNPVYIDKNYAGMFIIWDHMFGTYEEEVEEPIYGVTSPLVSWNPVTASFRIFFGNWKQAILVPGFKNKINFLMRPPGWNYITNSISTPPKIYPPSVKKYDTTIPLPLKVYILVQFIAVLYGFLQFYDNLAHLNGFEQLLLYSLILITLGALGNLMDKSGSKYSLELELARNSVLLLVGIMNIVPTYLLSSSSGDFLIQGKSLWLLVSKPFMMIYGFSILSLLSIVILMSTLPNYSVERQLPSWKADASEFEVDEQKEKKLL